MRATRCLALTFLALAMSVASAPSAGATTLTFDTSASPFTNDVLNQGWWSDVFRNYDENVNTYTGEMIEDDATPATGEMRSFFTFDLSSLLAGGPTITAATFETTRYVYDSADGSEDPRALRRHDRRRHVECQHRHERGDFRRPGRGTSYGAFVVDGYGPSDADTLVFTLNDAALVDIANAAGGFFSVGGSLQSIAPGPAGNLANGYSRDESIFGMSGQPGTLRG